MQSNVLNDLAKAKRLGRKKKWHSWEVHMTRPFFQPNQAPFPARETTEKSKTSQIAPRVQKAPLLIRMTPAWSWWSDDHAHIYVYSLLFGQDCVYSIALPIVVCIRQSAMDALVGSVIFIVRPDGVRVAIDNGIVCFVCFWVLVLASCLARWQLNGLCIDPIQFSFVSHCHYEQCCHCINSVNLHNAIVFPAW